MKKIIALILFAALALTMIACQNKDSGADATTAATTAAAKPGATQATAPAPIDPDDTGSDDEDEKLENDLYFVYGSAEIDGEKEDAWSKAQTVSIDLVKTGDVTGAKIDVRAMWDESALYFFFEIEDEILSFESSDGVGDWHNDGIYLYTCEDIDSGYDITTSGQFANGTYQFALINAELEKLPRYGEAVETASAYKITDKGMNIEFRYTPVDEMKEDTLKAGKQIFVDYQYNDCNSANNRSCALGYYNGTDTNFTPSMWAVAELLAKDAAIPEN